MHKRMKLLNLSKFLNIFPTRPLFIQKIISIYLSATSHLKLQIYKKKVEKSAAK